MKRIGMVALGLILVINCTSMGYAVNSSADEILKKCDYNLSPDTFISDVKLTINQQKRVDVKEMQMYGKGQEKTYALFKNPPREKNTAVLRLGENMWMYLPSAEKTVKMSGHMLRQSFMGSDFSNGDITERLKLREKYESTVAGNEKIENMDTTVLELKAKKADAAYFKRKLWVDPQRYIILKQEMYAKSGKLLKVMTINNVEKIGSRYFSTTIRMEDKLKRNSFSEMVYSNIKLDEPVEESVFTIQNLEKKR